MVISGGEDRQGMAWKVVTGICNTTSYAADVCVVGFMTMNGRLRRALVRPGVVTAWCCGSDSNMFIFGISASSVSNILRGL